jgi:hypothetical protein
MPKNISRSRVLPFGWGHTAWVDRPSFIVTSARRTAWIIAEAPRGQF